MNIFQIAILKIVSLGVWNCLALNSNSPFSVTSTLSQFPAQFIDRYLFEVDLQNSCYNEKGRRVKQKIKLREK